MAKTGIDWITYYTPGLYLDIEELAEKRGIEPAKLKKGLGLTAMALCDTDEDTVTMASEAVLKLIEQSGTDPRTIGRLYMGTESALDSAKPTATYVASVVEKAMEGKYGERCFKNCDVLDMTFACVGAVDALHNCLEWVRGDASRKAIVIASDYAKYPLASTGEYTQGAGAVAMLVSHAPRLCSVSRDFGIGMQGAGDFFKPFHSFSKMELLENALRAAGYPAEKADTVMEKLSEDAFWGHPDANVFLHRDEPVFDGPLSNDCYCARITEALEHFSSMRQTDVLDDWDRIIFHQPYAYQGRRMIVGNWVGWMAGKGRLGEIEQQAGMELTESNAADFYKAAAKTPLYRQFVDSRIEKGERASTLIGNMYTGSVFMSLVSMLRSEYDLGTDMSGKTVGCFAYGSGSKGKVFTLSVEPSWGMVVGGCDIFPYLASRRRVDFETYEKLHAGTLERPVSCDRRVSSAGVSSEPLSEGLRKYSVDGVII